MFDPISPDFTLDNSMTALVLSGRPNTGKTEYLIKRACSFAAKPQTKRVLFLSNTLRGSIDARELAKASTLAGVQEKIWFGTFKSIASRLLHVYGPAISLSPRFTVMDADDSVHCFRQIRAEQGVSQESKKFPDPRKLLEIYLQTINNQTNLVATLSTHFPNWTGEQKNISTVFKKYVAYKQAKNTLDSSDLPLYWNILLENPVGEAIKCLFQHVLVDNYEDRTNLESKIVKKMCANADLTAAGDPSQGVFSFLGGDPNHFLCLQKSSRSQNFHFSTPLGIDLRLDERASHVLTDTLVTKQTIPPNVLSVFATSSESEQSDIVIKRILQTRDSGIKLRDQVVLFRSGHLVDDLESQLIENEIPFLKNGSARPSETHHLKEVLALLRIQENPSDRAAWENIFSAIAPSKPNEVQQLIERLRVHKDTKGLDRFIHGVGQLSGQDNSSLSSLRSTFKKCRNKQLSFPEELDEMISFYTKTLLPLSENPQARQSNLNSLQDFVDPETTRSQFLIHLTLEPPLRPGERSNLAISDDYLSLNTIHASKGQTWKAAYLLHASDKEMPSHLAKKGVEMAEEKRLAYIAVSRATEQLVISYCRGSNTDPAALQQELSPFLKPSYGPYLEEIVLEKEADPPPIDLSDIGADKAVDQFFDHLWST